jgi:hypothetical protein
MSNVDRESVWRLCGAIDQRRKIDGDDVNSDGGLQCAIAHRKQANSEKREPALRGKRRQSRCPSRPREQWSS